jgi:hypothetical protein
MEATLPKTEARTAYELCRGLVLADLRDDFDSMNTILTELGVTDDYTVFLMCSMLAHAKTGLKRRGGKQAFEDELLNAARTNVSERW